MSFRKEKEGAQACPLVLEIKSLLVGQGRQLGGQETLLRETLTLGQ